MMIGVFKKTVSLYLSPITLFYAVFVVRQFCATFTVSHAISRHICHPSCSCTHDEFASSLNVSPRGKTLTPRCFADTRHA
jgi:hypothetical protein